MDNNEMFQEDEEASILVLTDGDGRDVEFEYLDTVEYQGKEYLVLTPLAEPEIGLVIMEIEPVDEETENYLAVEDETILNGVFAIFKERYKDILTFED